MGLHRVFLFFCKEVTAYIRHRVKIFLISKNELYPDIFLILEAVLKCTAVQHLRKQFPDETIVPPAQRERAHHGLPLPSLWHVYQRLMIKVAYAKLYRLQQLLLVPGYGSTGRPQSASFHAGQYTSHHTTPHQSRTCDQGDRLE